MLDPTRPKLVQFVEAPAFSRYRDDYLNDEGIRELQQSLAVNPEARDLIPGAGGMRKLRWRDPRRGKHAISGATLSHHLKVLTELGLITLRKEGLNVYYRTVPEKFAGYLQYLAGIGSRFRH
jgi:hypothetical protein